MERSRLPDHRLHLDRRTGRGKGGPGLHVPDDGRGARGLHPEQQLFLQFNANLTIATWSSDEQGSIGKRDFIVWSGENGAFAGLDVSGSVVHADTAYDQAYYGNKYTRTKQIIDSQINDANASKLLTELPS